MDTGMSSTALGNGDRETERVEEADNYASPSTILPYTQQGTLEWVFSKRVVSWGWEMCGEWKGSESGGSGEWKLIHPADGGKQV